MTFWSNVSSIIRSQVNNLVSSTKVMIETHIAERRYKTYSERIIKGLQQESIYTTEKMLNLTVTSMNSQRAGFSIISIDHFI